ncbi:MAG: hypothetical protein GEU99_16820 [Luteitalea sp.]|nr:hypothetical protein [Luteitalea sp.]
MVARHQGRGALPSPHGPGCETTTPRFHSSRTWSILGLAHRTRRDVMNALRLLAHAVLTSCVFAVALAVPAAGQDFRGRVTGVVADSSGAVLPGVTVTAQSPASLQPHATVSDEDGTYRLIALPPGVYEVTFELAGFQTLKHEGVRVVINTTLTLNASLGVASLAEDVTVSAESPVVDTTTTGVGTNFVKELLTEIPNARDVWAAMSQSAAIHVTGFDVGGSHTGTQTDYSTYGVNQQNTTRLEGINTTEGTDANAGYFDVGSFEEFQFGGAGNMADQGRGPKGSGSGGGSGGVLPIDGRDRTLPEPHRPGRAIQPHIRASHGRMPARPRAAVTGRPRPGGRVRHAGPFRQCRQPVGDADSPLPLPPGSS